MVYGLCALIKTIQRTTYAYAFQTAYNSELFDHLGRFLFSRHYQYTAYNYQYLCYSIILGCFVATLSTRKKNNLSFRFHDKFDLPTAFSDASDSLRFKPLFPLGHMVFPGCVSSLPRWASAKIFRTSFLASIGFGGLLVEMLQGCCASYILKHSMYGIFTCIWLLIFMLNAGKKHEKNVHWCCRQGHSPLHRTRSSTRMTLHGLGSGILN